jgi:senataxin
VSCTWATMAWLTVSRYMSAYPPSVRTNFFAAVDKWQISYILEEHVKNAQPGYGGSTTEQDTLLSLSPPTLQLLFAEPSLFDNPQISSLFDTTMMSQSSLTSKITALGLTTMLVRLLRSPQEDKRAWAQKLLLSAGKKPLSVDDWDGVGIGTEVESLYVGDSEGSLEYRWIAIRAILQSGCLDPECIRRRLLRCDDGRAKGIMPTLTAMLGNDSESKRTLCAAEHC